jgi:large subunit ribosomal protein L21
MYAVIKAGGKQHRVKAGDVIEIEAMKGRPGDTVQLRPLLVVDDEGKAHHGKDVAKAVVVAKLVGEQKGDKVKVLKFRPKSGYLRRQGHRQLMTLLEIEDVRIDGSAHAKAAKKEQKAEPQAAAEEPEAEEPEAEPDAPEAEGGAAREVTEAQEEADVTTDEAVAKGASRGSPQ